MDAELKREVRFLTTRLGAIIREQAGDRIFDHVEQIRQLAKTIRASRDPTAIRAKRRRIAGLTTAEAHQVAHAFSLFFQYGRQDSFVLSGAWSFGSPIIAAGERK